VVSLKLGKLLARHVTEGSAHKKIETRSSAISSIKSITIKRAPKLSYNINNNLNFNFYEMGVTLPENNTSQSDIWLGLDPLVSESNPTSFN